MNYQTILIKFGKLTQIKTLKRNLRLNWNCLNSRWRTAVILKIVFWPYFRSTLSNLLHILHSVTETGNKECYWLCFWADQSINFQCSKIQNSLITLFVRSAAGHHDDRSQASATSGAQLVALSLSLSLSLSDTRLGFSDAFVLCFIVNSTKSSRQNIPQTCDLSVSTRATLCIS